MCKATYVLRFFFITPYTYMYKERKLRDTHLRNTGYHIPEKKASPCGLLCYLRLRAEPPNPPKPLFLSPKERVCLPNPERDDVAILPECIFASS